MLAGRYCEAVLRRDPARFADCWTADGVWSIAGREPVRGREQIVDAFTELGRPYAQSLQQILNGVVEPTGPRSVRASWQVRELLWKASDDAGELVGVYHDNAVLESDGRCRLATREFELIYRGPVSLPGRLWPARPRLPGPAGAE